MHRGILLIKAVVIAFLMLTLPGMRCAAPMNENGLLNLSEVCLTFVSEEIPPRPRFPRRLGHIFLENTSNGMITVRLTTDDTRLMFRPPSLSLMQGQSARIEVVAVQNSFAPHTSSLQAEVIEADTDVGITPTTLVQQFTLEVRDGERVKPLRCLLETVAPSKYRTPSRNPGDATSHPLLGGSAKGGTLKIEGAFGLPVGKLRPNPSPNIMPRIPEPNIEAVAAFAQLDPFIDIDAALNGPDQRKGRTLCGTVGSSGLLVSPEAEDARVADTWLLISQVVDAEIPLADPINLFQYGFVFDSDENSANNWSSDSDIRTVFQGADRWYLVSYAPGAGWVLDVTVVTDPATNSTTTVSSGAFALVEDNVVSLFVPGDEFAAANPRFRLTSFRHSGDFGQNPPFDWSGDFWPNLDEPLQPVMNSGGVVF